MTRKTKTLMLFTLPALLVVGATVMGGCAANEASDITPQDAYALIQENQDNPDEEGLPATPSN